MRFGGRESTRGTNSTVTKNAAKNRCLSAARTAEPSFKLARSIFRAYIRTLRRGRVISMSRVVGVADGGGQTRGMGNRGCGAARRGVARCDAVRCGAAQSLI